MIKLTFAIDEGVVKHVGDLFIKTAPGDDSLKKEVLNMVVEKIIEGKDESFLTIDPQYTPSVERKMDTVLRVAMSAILHKSSEIMYENFQPHEQ